MLRDLFFIAIGINIGLAIGWIFCKKFDGNAEKLRQWMDKIF